MHCQIPARLGRQLTPSKKCCTMPKQNDGFVYVHMNIQAGCYVLWQVPTMQVGTSVSRHVDKIFVMQVDQGMKYQT